VDAHSDGGVSAESMGGTLTRIMMYLMGAPARLFFGRQFAEVKGMEGRINITALFFEEAVNVYTCGNEKSPKEK